MAKSKGGLTEWFKQDWVDIEHQKKVVALKMWQIQTKKQMLKENIQNAFQLQKRQE